MAASLVLACLCLGAGRVAAQDLPGLPPIPPVPTTAPAELPPGALATQAPPVNQAKKAAVQQETQLVQETKQEKKAPTLVYPHYDPELMRAQYTRARKGEEDMDFGLQTELPGPSRLYRRESENQLFERIRQDASRRTGAGKVIFPEEVALTREKYQGRKFDPSFARVEPGYVVHGRLLFEQRNFERQGWDLGILQPGIDLGLFYYDMAMLPYHMWTDPTNHYETNAGKCLPGDPTPLLLYPEPFSVTGLFGMAGTYMFGPFIFP